MLLGLQLLWGKGQQAARKMFGDRPRKRLNIALAVYAAVVAMAVLGAALFVGENDDGRGWLTDDDGKWLVAVLPASEYRPPGDGNAEGWAHLYVLCDKMNGLLRIGLGLGVESGLQSWAEGEAEVGVWEVIYTVGDAGGFAEVWASATSGEGAYLSPPAPDAVSDRLLAGGHMVAWAADLSSSGGGHEVIFDLGDYAEDVAAKTGGCGESLRT